jgi:hypothetical protein
MMRTRAHRDRMRKRVNPYVIRPGHPHFWTPLLGMTQEEILARVRGIVADSGVQPGCTVELAVLEDQDLWSAPPSRGTVIRISAVPRRDTNSLAVARWLSDPAERTPK